MITYKNSNWNTSWINFYDFRLANVELAEYNINKTIKDLILLDKYIITVCNDLMIYTLDVSNLDNIYIADSLELENQCQSLIVKSSYIYILSTNKIFVVDFSDKTNLNLIKTISFDHDLMHFVDYEEKLYVDAAEKCLIFDIKNPANPVLIDSLLLGMFSERLAVYKNYLYWLSYGIWVYNLNNKQYESALNFPDPLLNVSVFDNFGIAMTEGNDAYLLNLEYPSKPAVLEMIETGCNCGTIRGDYIYLLSDKLKVFLIKRTD